MQIQQQKPQQFTTKPLNKVSLKKLKVGKTKLISAAGTPGTIRSIDDDGYVMIDWENGNESCIKHQNARFILVATPKRSKKRK